MLYRKISFWLKRYLEFSQRESRELLLVLQAVELLCSIPVFYNYFISHENKFDLESYQFQIDNL